MKTPLPRKIERQPYTNATPEMMAINQLIDCVAEIQDLLKEREEVLRVERCGLGIVKREEDEEKPKLKEKLLSEIQSHVFQVTIKDYLPKVKAWKGGYDGAFDDGYAQAKNDIKALINRLMP